MTREEIYEQLNILFRDIFDDDELEIGETTTAADIEDWDSLVHINLIVAIEKCFQIKFSMSDVTSMKNVGVMVGIIQEKRNKQG